MTAETGDIVAHLHHDHAIKTAYLPRDKFGEGPPRRLRVTAVDNTGRRVLDVFVLTDGSSWPNEAVYAYLGSIPTQPALGG